jgi:carbon monoxide dehydrogenase subunit G
MEFDNDFEVPLPPDSAWRVLMDIERIAPCMPGAELTEKVDDTTYKGRVRVRLGPVSLSFSGVAHFEDIDCVGRTAQVKAAGTDAKGRGGANSTVSFRVEPSGTGSKVSVHTDLFLSGSIAQYGRGAGLVQEVAAQLIKQFATSLRKMVDAQDKVIIPSTQELTYGTSVSHGEEAGERLTSPQSSPQFAAPISGFSLMLRVLWNSIRGLFKTKQEIE